MSKAKKMKPTSPEETRADMVMGFIEALTIWLYDLPVDYIHELGLDGQDSFVTLMHLDRMHKLRDRQVFELCYMHMHNKWFDIDKHYMGMPEQKALQEMQ